MSVSHWSATDERRIDRGVCDVRGRTSGPRGARGLVVASAVTLLAALALMAAGCDHGRTVMVWLTAGALAAWPSIREVVDEPFGVWAGRWIVVAVVVTVLLHLEAAGR